MTGSFIVVLGLLVVGLLLIGRGSLKSEAEVAGDDGQQRDEVPALRTWVLDVVKREWPILRGAESSPGERMAAAGVLLAGASLIGLIILLTWDLAFPKGGY
jgi:hypothetical protein